MCHRRYNDFSYKPLIIHLMKDNSRRHLQFIISFPFSRPICHMQGKRRAQIGFRLARRSEAAFWKEGQAEGDRTAWMIILMNY